MPSYEHKKLIERIAPLVTVPTNEQYRAWTIAQPQLALLLENAKEDELIIHAVGPHIFVHAVVVDENSLTPLDHDDLLNWNSDPYSSVASYVWGGGRDDVWIERNRPIDGTQSLQDSRQLVFARELDGVSGNEPPLLEISQEYIHVTSTFWRSEQHAYCRFDEQGDWDHVVSITRREPTHDITLVSFKRQPLEEYLAASDSVLVRLFDFSSFDLKTFNGWPDGPEKKVIGDQSFFFRQKVVEGYAGYTRGVQIVRPARPRTELFSSITGHGSGGTAPRYVEFLAQDWRNRRVANISTDPSATTNYFEAGQNSLPFELSPAFFRPEVLLKYKGDTEKYKVGDRDIHCRGAWTLRGYDVNEAEQVHAYICDLRGLPYKEQEYWKSFNEKPKSSISQRAFTTDFEGAWSDLADPLQDIRRVLWRWVQSDSGWWKPRDETLLERITKPRTTSRDEWAEAFADLSKLIIEGLQVKFLRDRLKERNLTFRNGEKSLVLIERLLDAGRKLDGLRTVQFIRSKNSAHAAGSEAAELADRALDEHGTYSAHFEHVCGSVAQELQLVEEVLSQMETTPEKPDA